jgi:hypothetical protein
LYQHNYHHFCRRISWLQWGLHWQRLHGIAISSGYYCFCCWTKVLRKCTQLRLIVKYLKRFVTIEWL